MGLVNQTNKQSNLNKEPGKGTQTKTKNNAPEHHKITNARFLEVCIGLFVDC